MELYRDEEFNIISERFKKQSSQLSEKYGDMITETNNEKTVDILIEYMSEIDRITKEYIDNLKEFKKKWYEV